MMHFFLGPTNFELRTIRPFYDDILHEFLFFIPQCRVSCCDHPTYSLVAIIQGLYTFVNDQE
jgi:hypothetical protein